MWLRLDKQSARLNNQASAVVSHDDQLAEYEEDLDALASASSWDRWEIDYRSEAMLRTLDEPEQRAYSVERIVRQTPNVSAVGDLLEASVVKVLNRLRGGNRVPAGYRGERFHTVRG